MAASVAVETGSKWRPWVRSCGRRAPCVPGVRSADCAVRYWTCLHSYSCLRDIMWYMPGYIVSYWEMWIRTVSRLYFVLNCYYTSEMNVSQPVSLWRNWHSFRIPPPPPFFSFLLCCLLLKKWMEVIQSQHGVIVGCLLAAVQAVLIALMATWSLYTMYSCCLIDSGAFLNTDTVRSALIRL